ncbi:hypothetical protein EYC84_008291 [Monilinia fructicola]|uniref:Uncharacterized protein n=1 Tax=Monilinia fructicola TaxID=38448 RepID=A0A5M9JJB9_MONFR|nr:hypothetical protein EYC84_008291 [Monilinia fructicola]
MATNDIKSPNPNRMSTISTTSGTTDTSATAELSLVVDELLNSLSNKFAGVSSEIFAKMDEMSRRLDNLEATLQSNMESKDGRGSPTKIGIRFCTNGRYRRAWDEIPRLFLLKTIHKLFIPHTIIHDYQIWSKTNFSYEINV